MILNWPERIKTQPHDDRDNCFLPFDSKGPCGMTANNDIDDDSATKHSDSHKHRVVREVVAPAFDTEKFPDATVRGGPEKLTRGPEELALRAANVGS